MEPWKERLIEEFKELNTRREKLKNFLQNPTIALLKEERDMLVIQYSGMMLYQEALEARLEYYKIKIEE